MSAGYSCREPRFNSQHLYGNSLYITPVLREPMSSSGLHGHQVYMGYIYVNVCKTLTRIKIKIHPKKLGLSVGYVM